MAVESLHLKYKYPIRIAGENDVTEILIERSGTIRINKHSSLPKDEFTVPQESETISVDSDKASQFLDNLGHLDDGGLDPGGNGVTVTVVTDDTDSVSNNSQEPAAIRDIRIALIPFVDIGSDECDNYIPRHTKDELDSMLSESRISSDVYHSLLDKLQNVEERRTTVDDLLESRRYISERSRSDIIKDHSLGLISDDQYNMFVWYCRNIPSMEHRENSMISVKLKLSVWGLRIGGRFDTFEFLVDKDDMQMTDRSYCVHGTLFEGCGNYKAPDAARYTDFTKERIDMIFDYLQQLEDLDILGRNFSEPRYDCGFFDLYVRYEDRDSVHTKGTTEYPYFIKYLMYLMDAKESL